MQQSHFLQLSLCVSCNESISQAARGISRDLHIMIGSQLECKELNSRLSYRLQKQAKPYGPFPFQAACKQEAHFVCKELSSRPSCSRPTEILMISKLQLSTRLPFQCQPGISSPKSTAPVLGKWAMCTSAANQAHMARAELRTTSVVMDDAAS